MKKLFAKTWDWVKPYLTWKMLPFLLIAWMITNGWAYVFVITGNTWMVWLGSAWISILWFPFTIEKIFTIAIAGALYRVVYKEDFKKGDNND